MKKITIGISGGIASYKIASLISYLKKFDIDVHVIMTKHATSFITPLTLEVLSKNKVLVDEFKEANDEYIPHIEFAQNTDLLVIAPATANIIGKIACGIADDLLSSTVLASNRKVLIVPAMNTVMYKNSIVQNNINILINNGYRVMEPISKNLACGVEGLGALPNIKDISDEINKIINFEEEKL